MAGFPKKDRQKIIDDYLAVTGRNMFIPSEFVDWLAGETEHDAYEWFYGKDDAEMAREHRISLARQMASGLRIVVQNSSKDSKVVHITSREYPAFVSPVSGRKDGGGYAPFNPDDPDAVAELARQAGTALRAWLARYRGVSENAGIPVTNIEKIATALEGRVAKSA